MTRILAPATLLLLAETRRAERIRCEAIVRRYIENPASGPQNNTREAFDMGMNHEAGAIDNASAILAAIRSLPDNA